jgi:hypothetical protein
MSTEKDSNPDVEEVLRGEVADDAEGSTDFFDSLEQQVNGAISDENIPQPETEQVTQQADPEDTGNEVQTDWKAKAETLEKRYSDSTREAQRLKAENDGLSELSKFKPLIEHLKNSPDAVQALRDNIGGKPRSLTERFGDDFVFDAHEAMADPKSDSAQVMQEYIAKNAQQQAAAIINREKQQFQVEEQQIDMARQADEFKQRTGMSDAEFEDLQARANEHVLTLDDVYYLLNRDQVSKNVADNTKADMLNQMKQVRDIPQSASNANSPGREAQSPDDKMFDILKGLDEGAENMFG